MSLSVNAKINHKELSKTKSHVERAHLYRAAHNAIRTAPSNVLRTVVDKKQTGKEAPRLKLLLKRNVGTESAVVQGLKAKRIANDKPRVASRK